MIPPHLVFTVVTPSGRLNHDLHGVRSPPPLVRSSYRPSDGNTFFAHQDENGETVIDGEVSGHLTWNHYCNVEDIATVHDVPRDAHCGYYALLRSLYPIFPASEEAAIAYRKKLWMFVDEQYEDIKERRLVPMRDGKMETLCQIYGGEGNDHNNERYYMGSYILQFVALMEQKSIFLYVQDGMNQAPYSTIETMVFFFDANEQKIEMYNFRERTTAPTKNAIGIFLNQGHFQGVEYKEFIQNEVE